MTSTEFLLENDEKTVKQLEGSWHAVRHGRKFEWSKSMFRFELLRKLTLTNKRLVFLKDESVEYEVPLKTVERAEIDKVGFTGNPYFRLELKDGNAVSVFLGCIGVKMFLGAFYLLGKQRKLTKEWTDAINNQLKRDP